MNILQVLPALNAGGVERGTLEISQALVTAGHNSTVVSNGGSLVAELEHSGAKHIQLPVHSKNPLRIWYNARQLTELITRENIDLIHVRSRAPAWSCLRAANLTQKPLLSTFHGRYGHQYAIKRFYNSAMLRGQACIAVSDFIREHIEQCYPQRQARLHTIYRGIDMDHFNAAKVSAERIDALRQQWQLENAQGPVILLPGRLTRLKGHDIFIEALAKLHKHKVRALIVGPIEGREEYVAHLKQASARLHPAADIRFVGGCRDMPAAYCLADIVVSSSSKPESFGRTLCEAQAMGKLVVGSNHGGTQETTAPAQRAGLFEPNNAQAMAEALERQLSLSAEQTRSIGEQSRAHIAKHFNLQGMCEQTLALYHELLAH